MEIHIHLYPFCIVVGQSFERLERGTLFIWTYVDLAVPLVPYCILIIVPHLLLMLSLDDADRCPRGVEGEMTSSF